MSTDGWTLLFIHFLLLLFLIISLKNDIMANRGKGATLSVAKRGESSMNALYTLYGVATIAYSLAVDVSTIGIGHKATIVVLDYIVFTYLFFFNIWFRNRIVFNIAIRISKD